MTLLNFTKGHGTRNDFVLLDDSGNALDLDASLVAELADRRGGIGADGVIRVVQSKDLEEGRAVLQNDPSATWFMDYRNADGSIAAMCGNGVRVFAAFLEELGLVDFSSGLPVAIGTRAGLRTVRKEADWFTVGMGKWHFPGGSVAEQSGMDSTVHIAGLDGMGAHSARPALSVDMGNPHTVVAVASLDELAAIDFTAVPAVDPLPADGTNVEVVVPLENHLNSQGELVGHISMRVHERGVGETQSCGTGACAAALAVRHWARLAASDTKASVPDVWRVDVPGGRVQVRVLGSETELSGPAVLLAQGQIEIEKLRA